MTDIRRFVALLPLVAIFSSPILLGGTARAAPRITNLPIRGLQAGGVTTLTIQGSDLLPEPRLLLDAIVEQTLINEGSTPTQIKLRVTLDAKATPGLYNLRLANRLGVSSAVVVAVDKLPQVTFGERIETTPIAMHGVLSGSNIARAELSGKKDQPLVVEVESQRLGGKLRPVLHLYDSDRKQLAMAMPATSLGGDARLIATLPADGSYTIELHDSRYAAPAPGFYRLKVGQFQFADQAFPPAIQRGKATPVTLLGNLAGAKPAMITAGPDKTVLAAPWPALELASGWRPRVLVSDTPELLEDELLKDELLKDELLKDGAKRPQNLPAVPVAVSGRLDQPGQEDVYRLPVKEGDKLRFEVFSERLGSPTDTLLELRNDKGGRLALNDDTAPSTDSRIDYTVAKGVNQVDVSIKDQLRRGDPRCVYRLVVSPVATPPSFRLKVAEDAQNVRQGATRVFRVVAERGGYNGPIRLAFDDLPAGVSVSGARIAAGSNGALITLHADAGDIQSVVTSIRGTSEGLTPPITSVAVNDKHPLAKLQPWLQSEIAMSSAAGNATPFSADWSQPSATTQLVLGTTFKAPLKLKRPPRAIGPVRVSLVSAEPPLLVNGKPDANRNLRAEKPTLDIPVDPKAKAALDALTASDSALAAATATTKSVKAANDKALAAAQTAVKTAKDKRTAAERVSVAMVAKRKAAEAKLKAAMAEFAEADKAVVAAETTLASATAELTAMETKLTEQTAKAKTAMDGAETARKAAEAKRMAADKAFVAAEANIKSVVEYNVIVPPNLALAPRQDFALKVELRSLDNKQVLAEVYTPVRRFTPLNPLGIRLPGDPAFVAKLDAKAGGSVKIRGQVERKAGFAGDVTVTVSGQPKGVAAPKQVLKADQHDFELELKFPANFAQRQVDSIKVVASGPPNPKAAKIVVRSEAAVSITLLPPDKKP